MRLSSQFFPKYPIHPAPKVPFAGQGSGGNFDLARVYVGPDEREQAWDQVIQAEKDGLIKPREIESTVHNHPDGSVKGGGIRVQSTNPEAREALEKEGFHPL